MTTNNKPVIITPKVLHILTAHRFTFRLPFTQLRGHKKVSGEWQLVTLAYNMKRLWKMQTTKTPLATLG